MSKLTNKENIWKPTGIVQRDLSNPIFKKQWEFMLGFVTQTDSTISYLGAFVEKQLSMANSIDEVNAARNFNNMVMSWEDDVRDKVKENIKLAGTPYIEENINPSAYRLRGLMTDQQTFDFGQMPYGIRIRGNIQVNPQQRCDLKMDDVWGNYLYGAVLNKFEEYTDHVLKIIPPQALNNCFHNLSILIYNQFMDFKREDIGHSNVNDEGEEIQVSSEERLKQKQNHIKQIETDGRLLKKLFDACQDDKIKAKELAEISKVVLGQQLYFSQYKKILIPLFDTIVWGPGEKLRTVLDIVSIVLVEDEKIKRAVGKIFTTNDNIDEMLVTDKVYRQCKKLLEVIVPKKELNFYEDICKQILYNKDEDIAERLRSFFQVKTITKTLLEKQTLLESSEFANELKSETPKVLKKRM